MPDRGAEEPVTVVITRVVRREHIEEFEGVLHETAQAALELPGHLGLTVLRPEAVGTGRYTVIFRFDGAKHLDGWLRSEAHVRFLERIGPLVEDEVAVQRLTGLETWFVLPGEEAIVPPPRWKQAVLSWLGGYPTATLFFLVLGSEIEGLPLLVRTLILSTFLILALTYVVMPRLTSVARRWLYPGT